MKRIIHPVGKPVKRINIDIDIQGQVVVNGVQRGHLGQTVPMSVFDVACVLSNVVASTLATMAGAIPMQTQANTIKPHDFKPREDNNDFCEVCGENPMAEYHMKGGPNDGEETTH